MAPPPVIRSAQNPAVKRLVRLRKPRERRAAGVLLAEGRREVERATQAGLRCRELWIDPDQLGSDPFKHAFSRASPAPAGGGVVYETTARVFAKIAYHQRPEGLLGVFEAPTWTLDDLTFRSPGRGLVLVAVGTEKPGNLGAMVRTAAAAGCDAVLAVGPAVDVFNPNAIRTSTGAVFSLPTVVVEDEARAIGWLHDRRVRIAAALAEGGQGCFASDWGGDAGQQGVALVIGPEHAGLGPAWAEAADVALTIPLADPAHGVDSLNASNAAAVLLFEAVRRRRG
jgi:TrmH family RNA methyltransferase